MLRADSEYELYVMDADPARHAADAVLRAADEACMWCRVEDCEGAFGGLCPLLEEEEDARDLADIKHAAANGTL